MTNTSSKPIIYLLAGSHISELREDYIECFEREYPQFHFATYEREYPNNGRYDRDLDMELMKNSHAIIAITNDSGSFDFGRGVHCQLETAVNILNHQKVYLTDSSEDNYDEDFVWHLKKGKYNPSINNSDWKISHACLDVEYVKKVDTFDWIFKYWIKELIRGDLESSLIERNYSKNTIPLPSFDHADDSILSGPKPIEKFPVYNKKKLLYYYVSRRISTK